MMISSDMTINKRVRIMLMPIARRIQSSKYSREPPQSYNSRPKMKHMFSVWWKSYPNNKWSKKTGLPRAMQRDKHQAICGRVAREAIYINFNKLAFSEIFISKVALHLFNNPFSQCPSPIWWDRKCRLLFEKPMCYDQFYALVDHNKKFTTYALLSKLSLEIWRLQEKNQ